MFKNIFILTFLGLFVVSCSKYTTDVSDDSDDDLDCSLPANSSEDECKKDDPLTDAEKEAINNDRIEVAKGRGNFFYLDYDGATKTWLASGETEEEKFESVSDFIYFTLGDNHFKKSFLFSKGDTSYEDFSKINDARSAFVTTISPEVADTDEHVSSSYVDGKYIGIAVTSANSAAQLTRELTYNIYQIYNGYFFIPVISDHAFGFLNRGKANNHASKLFEGNDILDASYVGLAWGHYMVNSSQTRIEGTANLIITANPLDPGNKLTFTFLPPAGADYFTSVEIANLDFTEPTAAENTNNPYYTGYFEKSGNPKGTIADAATVTTVGGNTTCTNTAFAAVTGCGAALTIVFAGENSEQVGGHYVFDATGSKGIYFGATLTSAPVDK